MVDDEKWVLKELQSCIDWKACGFEICGFSTSPVTAEQEIIAMRPDLVLTDVSMREMNGLELAERIGPTPICFISAYDDFKFAKKAIALHAVDYLLKPIDIDELKAVLERVKARLINGRQASPRRPIATSVRETVAKIAASSNKNELLYRLQTVKTTAFDDAAVVHAAERKVDELFGVTLPSVDACGGFDVWLDRTVETVERQPDLPDNAAILKILDDIRGDLGGELSLTDYAEKYGYSVSWLSQLFKKHTGEAFVTYVVKARVERAKTLILKGEGYSLSQICFMVGYDDYYHFSKIFKKYTGYSPKSFKETFCVKKTKA